MKFSRYSPSSASIICSSCPVPRVATQSACVSPRVNRAEPCARGRTPTSAMIGRTVRVSRPSMRRPVSRMALRTMSASRSLKAALGLLRIHALGGQRRGGGLFRGGDLLVARLLDLLLIRLGDPGCGPARPPARPAPALRPMLRQRPRLLRGTLGQFDDRVDHRLERRVPERDRAEHDVFRQLLSLGFDHQHALGGAGEHQFQLRWSSSASAVGFRMYSPSHVADARRGDRAEERDAGQGQRRRAADHRDDVRVVLDVVAQHRGDDLDLIAETLAGTAGGSAGRSGGSSAPRPRSAGPRA